MEGKAPTPRKEVGIVKEPTRISKFLFGFSGRLMACLGVMLFVFTIFIAQAQAFEIKADNPDVRTRFDNTITYSLIYRLSDQDPALISDPNTDDGNRNFDQGLAMVRFDLLSEFDVVYKKFGVRFSGAAWNDSMYNKPNDNDSPGTVNATSVSPNHFTKATNKLHGRDGELLEAFTFGAADLGDMTFRYRIGQFTQWWGDAFFMGANGIASGLAPVDVAKAATLPNVQLKELIRPIPQVSGQLQVTDDLALGAYYQFRFEPARLFAQGSLFSPADLIGPGAEHIITDPTNPDAWFIKGPDMEPGDSGQYGFQVKYDTMFASYGLYMLNYHSKDSYVVVKPIDGQYTFFYPKDIQAYGASMNFAWDQYTFSGEVTLRKNAPFQSQDIAIFPDFGPFVNMPHEPMYAKGDSLHVTLNTFSGGMRGNFFCDSQDLIFEVGWNKELSVNDESLLKTGYDDSGLLFQIVYEPKWFQVLPGLNLHLPMGANYAPNGPPTTMLSGAGTNDGGDFNIGIYGKFEEVWEACLSYRNFFGETKYQAFADRDYVSFYIRRAF